MRGECALSAVYCAGMARALGSPRSPQRFDAQAAIEQRGISGNDKYTNVDVEPASDSDAGPGADADAGPGRVHHLGNKQVFRPAPGRTLAPCPPPRLGTRRARVRTRRYLWTVQAPRPARTVAVLDHLRADAS